MEEKIFNKKVRLRKGYREYFVDAKRSNTLGLIGKIEYRFRDIMGRYSGWYPRDRFIILGDENGNNI